MKTTSPTKRNAPSHPLPLIQLVWYLAFHSKHRQIRETTFFVALRINVVFIRFPSLLKIYVNENRSKTYMHEKRKEKKREIN